MHSLSLIRSSLLVAVAPAAPSPATSDPHSPASNYYSTSSMNVLSFGFLAAAIFISIFLVVAVFERLLYKPPQLPTAFIVGETSGHTPPTAEMDKMGLVEVSVLMPGQTVPTFIARPAPIMPSEASSARIDEFLNLSKEKSLKS